MQPIAFDYTFSEKQEAKDYQEEAKHDALLDEAKHAREKEGKLKFGLWPFLHFGHHIEAVEEEEKVSAGSKK
jgi:hypothetical protein